LEAAGVEVRKACYEAPSRNESHDRRISEVVECLNEASSADVTLVGHSDGGLVARVVAERNPTCVRQLVLLNPSPARWFLPMLPTLPLLTIWKLCCYIPAAIRDGNMVKPSKKDAADLLFNKRSPEFDFDSAYEAMRLEALTVALEIALGRYASMITVPTTVFSASEDMLIGPSIQRAEAARSSARLVELKGEDHMFSAGTTGWIEVIVRLVTS
jgi:pimeloyl-ACP methyl ester carboxylesterase